jgi:hypothetical protein
MTAVVVGSSALLGIFRLSLLFKKFGINPHPLHLLWHQLDRCLWRQSREKLPNTGEQDFVLFSFVVPETHGTVADSEVEIATRVFAYHARLFLLPPRRRKRSPARVRHKRTNFIIATVFLHDTAPRKIRDGLVEGSLEVSVHILPCI